MFETQFFLKYLFVKVVLLNLLGGKNNFTYCTINLLGGKNNFTYCAMNLLGGKNSPKYSTINLLGGNFLQFRGH